MPSSGEASGFNENYHLRRCFKGSPWLRVYIRHKYENNEVTCRLVTSKSKVAPLTPVTIPKLELMGAVLGLRLTQSVIAVLHLPMQDVIFYSDSIDVLWWIRGHGKDFRPFVANLVGEIQSGSDPSQWQHVPTNENSADLCTRRISPLQLAEHPLWWEGPEWIKTCEDVRMKFEKRPTKLPESRVSPSPGENDRVVSATNAQEKEDNSRKLENGDLIQRDFQVGRGTLECLLE